MTTRATGRTKNILLTIWLCLPILVVGGLVAGIFIAYSKGPAMDARPVGQGRGDTGGANALGEWLAGNDPSEVERTRRDLREGRLIDPLDWPHGVRLRFPDLAADSAGMVIGWDGGDSFNFAIGGTDGDTELTHEQLQLVFATGMPKAGIYLSTGTFSIVRGEPVTENGETIPVRFPLIDASETVPGQPIEITIPLSDG